MFSVELHLIGIQKIKFQFKMKKFFFRSRKYFDFIEKERDEVNEKIDINLRYLSNVSLMKTRYFIIIVNK